MESSQFLSTVARDVFKEVEAIVHDKEKLSDGSLLALNSVFGTVLERSLAIVDKPNSVCELESPIGRKVIQVSGTAQGVYSLYPLENFCPCPAFQFYVLGAAPSELTCKHVLAAWLARILGKSRRLVISEDTMTTLLTSMLLPSQTN